MRGSARGKIRAVHLVAGKYMSLQGSTSRCREVHVVAGHGNKLKYMHKKNIATKALDAAYTA
jgi:hypothetical protein